MRIASTRLVSQAAAVLAALTLVAEPSRLPALAAPPTAEAKATLQTAFQAAATGLLSNADSGLSASIREWKRTDQPADEVAAILKQRGIVRQRQGRFTDALADVDEALKLALLPNSKADPAEVQRSFVLRARINEALRRWKEAESDLTAAIDRLESLDAIESNNPFLYAERATARAQLQAYGGASEDSLRASADFRAIGDRVRRLTSETDAALFQYGAGELPEAVERMRWVFANVGKPTSNNPDDIGLLQELSRKEAELHIAYAAHLFAAEGRTAEAAKEWDRGCVRLNGFVADAVQRRQEEAALREAEAKRAEARGADGETLRASSVAENPFNNRFAALLNGMDPDSPYVTQRPERSFFYYQVGESGIERRDEGISLAQVDSTLSCTQFRDAAWLRANRPEWAASLVNGAAQYAAAVPQAPIKVPPRKAPADCTVVLGQPGVGDAVPCF